MLGIFEWLGLRIISEVVCHSEDLWDEVYVNDILVQSNLGSNVAFEFLE